MSFPFLQATFTDTYTPDELARCSWWCLTAVSGPRGTYIGLRDHAMLLLSTSTAFRGESARILQWSDLFMSEMPLDDVRPGVRVPVGDMHGCRRRCTNVLDLI